MISGEITILLFVVGLISSLINTVTGFAGGVIMFSAMTYFLDLPVAIALHGLFQSLSNVLRVVAFRHHINFKICLIYSVFIVPGCYIGSQILPHINPRWAKVVIGCIVVWIASKPLYQTIKRKRFLWGFLPLGFVSSTTSMLIGVVGPVIAPFFLMANLNKKSFVATKSFCQGAVQITKVILFSSVIPFDYKSYGNEIILISLAIVMGTIIGKQLFSYISEDYFKKIVKWILYILGFSMILGVS